MLIVKFYDKLTPRQIGRYGFMLYTAALLWLAFMVHNDWLEFKVLIDLVMCCRLRFNRRSISTPSTASAMTGCKR